MPTLSHPCCKGRVCDGYKQRTLWDGPSPEHCGCPRKAGWALWGSGPSANNCPGEEILKYNLHSSFPSEKQWALLTPRHFSSRGLYFLLCPKTRGCQLSLVLPLCDDPLASAGIVDCLAFWISWLPWITGQKGCQHFDFNYNCYN